MELKQISVEQREFFTLLSHIHNMVFYFHTGGIMTVEKLGARVRKYREERNITREELAKAANLSVEFITSLEDSNIYPSIGPLQKVARSLGVRLGTFMDDVACADPVIVKKNQRRSDADLTMHSSEDKNPAFRFHSLGKGKADRNMEPFFIELTTEAEEDRKLSSHQGEEFVIVTKGQVILYYGLKKTILEEGDTVYYNSIVPHYLGGYGNEPAEIFAVIYHPI